MSTVEARGDRYLVRFRQGGKSKARTFTNEPAAQRWKTILDAAGPDAALALLKDQLAGRDASEGLTVAAWVEKHIAGLTGVTDGTKKEYRSYAARDIDPILGALPLSALSRDAVADWINHLAAKKTEVRKVDADGNEVITYRTLSGKSIKNRHSLLSGACTAAVRAGHLASNPCKGLRIPRTEGEEMVFLTHNEFTILYNATPERWRPLIYTLAGTGLRWGEATALQVGDLDLDHVLPDGRRLPIVNVNRAWKHTAGKGHVLGPPKSPKARRSVSLDPALAEMLRPLAEGRKADEFLFTNSHGGPVRQNSFHQRVWDPTRDRAAAAGLAKRPRIHDLRHSHASWLIQSRQMDLLDIQHRLGHESAKTTLDVYGHRRPDGHVAAAAVISIALSGALPQLEPPAPPEIEG